MEKTVGARVRQVKSWTLLAGGISVLIVGLAACVQMKQLLGVEPETLPRSTYEKFRKLAVAGNAESQNLLGFMLFFGEAAPVDRPGAHRWFHAAAAQGNAIAQLNLAVMHHHGAGVPKDDEEAEWYFRLARENSLRINGSSPIPALPGSLDELVERGMAGKEEVSESPGEVTFVTFCAGCHGLNGIAAYVGAPSFAIGERMEKSDTELLGTIRKGHGEMPIWGNKLSARDITEALSFARSFQAQYRKGIAQVPRTRRSLYFLFGPMSDDITGYRSDRLK